MEEEERQSLNKGVYKSTILPPEGERLVVGGNILQSLEARTIQAEERLAQVENELRKETDRLRNIREHITNEAQLEAKRIIEDATRQIEAQRAQLEEAKRLAEDEGRRLGQAAGYQEGKEERTRLLKQIEQILDTAKKKHEEILKAAEEEIVDLAILVAEKIIRREVEKDSEVVISTIKEALKRLTAKEEITIRVNIDEVGVVKEHKDEFMAQTKGLRAITFKEDSGIERGGCRIDTDFGSIDATISTQLEEIRKGLLQKAKELGMRDEGEGMSKD